jgi:tetratricopeptide (TPR) repeat protein
MGKIGSYANVLKYKLAVASARKVDDPLRLAHTVRHLGDAYYYAKRFSLAEPCYVEALSIYRQREDRRRLDLANAIRSFAVLKDEIGAPEEAMQFWREAHDLYTSLGIPAGVAESAARLALRAAGEGDFEQSREWLSEACTAADASDDPETVEYVCGVTAQLQV